MKRGLAEGSPRAAQDEPGNGRKQLVSVHWPTVGRGPSGRRCAANAASDRAQSPGRTLAPILAADDDKW